MESAPLSFAQQRLWFLDQWEPESPVHAAPHAIRLTGTLVVAALERSLQEILRRHEILRATFPAVDGVPVQVIGPIRERGLPLVDLQPLPAPEREAAAMQQACAEARRPFDLARGPLFRASLLRLDDQDHLLLLTVQHIVFDTWSSRVLLEELIALYAGFSTGQPSPLPELPMQYAEYARWQREWLQGERLESQLAYWKRQLGGAPTLLSLPADRPRPPTQTFAGARMPLQLTEGLCGELRTLSQRSGVTLFMTLLAAFQTLLHRLSGQEEICVGTPFAGRTHLKTERLIGFFANTLVLRTDLSGDPPFQELLVRVREVALAAYEHPDLPFGKLVEELQPEQSPSHPPLFQVMFVLLSLPREAAGPLSNLTFQALEVDTGTAKFDLTLTLIESEDRLSGWIEYNRDLFDAATISRMAGHWQVMLETIAATPEQRLSQLPLLTEAGRKLLLVEWNQTRAEYPRERPVHALVETQVERTPDAIAVVDEGRQITYQELNRRANQLARYLQSLGVGARGEASGLVGLCGDRSLEMVVGLLGILKAGGACLPLDLSSPKARLTFMLQEAQPQVLLTQRRLVEQLPEHVIPLVVLDTAQSAIAAQESENPSSPAGAESLLYVIYTSGSTGRPKGVAMPHRPLANLLCWQFQNSTAAGETRTLQFAPLSFDVAFQEIFATLGSGGTLVLVPDEVRRDPAALWSCLAKEAVERVFLPPVALQQLAELVERQSQLRAPTFRIPPLREVITAGEALQITPAVVRLFEKLPGCRLQNQYGPTETHVVTSNTLSGPPASWPALPSIGRPIANTRIYLLDGQRQPVPIGVPGELYVGGEALAQGYLQQPDLTAERFLDFGFWAGERLYRTGDMARYRADGSIEFLGRRDRQVKIRGFRIELEEIETALRQHPAVREAVVRADEIRPGEKRLVGYIVPHQRPGPKATELRGALLERLPEYMLPATFVMLEALPLTPNGKLDRQALPMPEPPRPESAEAEGAPRTPAEAALAGIWAEVLGHERVGVHDNFFDLGGHSLLAVRLQARIERAFRKEVPLVRLFQAPTVEQQAALLREEGEAAAWTSLVPIQPCGTRPPLFCVHGVGGHVRGYRELARHLGPDQPVYGLQAQGMDGKAPIHTRVEEMAAHYVREIRSLQPEGPYRLEGASSGGIVAFEMARQLQAQGQAVALLALMDSSGPRPLHQWRVQGIRRRLAGHLQLLRQLEPKEKLRYALARVRGVKKHLAWLMWKAIYRSSSGQGKGGPGTLEELRRIHRRAVEEYPPQAYAGRVILFRARQQSVAADNDPAMGWGRLARGGVEIYEVPGNHMSMLEPPHLPVLTEKLRDCLQKAQG